VHYYAAGYYYAAKRKGLIDKRADNPIGAFASAAASGTVSASAKSKSTGVLKTSPKDLKERIKEIRQHGDSNVASSSDMYTGKTDYF
jgi:hypothetical protein